MTCIVGIKTDDGAILGGDSAGVSGLSIESRADTKVFENGPYLIGYTSSFRMGQLLRYAELPKPKPLGDLYKFMVTEFVDAIRKVFKDGGYARKDNEVEHAGTFLVGVKGRLFKIEADYQVGEPLLGYTAVGCGEDIALGSLHSTADPELEFSPYGRVWAALKAAQEFSAGVREPFSVIEQ